jgi:N utilization substance protein B
VPARVVINEAVELAKQFGTSESPAFVNGILDKIAQQLRRSEVS